MSRQTLHWILVAPVLAGAVAAVLAALWFVLKLTVLADSFLIKVYTDRGCHPISVMLRTADHSISFSGDQLDYDPEVYDDSWAPTLEIPASESAEYELVVEFDECEVIRGEPVYVEPGQVFRVYAESSGVRWNEAR